MNLDIDFSFCLLEKEELAALLYFQNTPLKVVYNWQNCFELILKCMEPNEYNFHYNDFFNGDTIVNEKVFGEIVVIFFDKLNKYIKVDNDNIKDNIIFGYSDAKAKLFRENFSVSHGVGFKDIGNDEDSFNDSTEQDEKEEEMLGFEVRSVNSIFDIINKDKEENIDIASFDNFIETLDYKEWDDELKDDDENKQ